MKEIWNFTTLIVSLLQNTNNRSRNETYLWLPRNYENAILASLDAFLCDQRSHIERHLHSLCGFLVQRRIQGSRSIRWPWIVAAASIHCFAHLRRDSETQGSLSTSSKALVEWKFGCYVAGAVYINRCRRIRSTPEMNLKICISSSGIQKFTSDIQSNQREVKRCLSR